MFLDLGMMPDAEVKTKEQLKDDKLYPLKLYYCRNCHLVQVIDIIPAEHLFTNYIYRSSVTKTLIDHFRDYAQEISSKFVRKEKGEFLAEFGCNDGVLLVPLKEKGINAVGIDPAKTLIDIAKERGINVISDYFTRGVAEDIVASKGKAKMITGSNVFAHIDNLDEVMKAVNILLKDDGIFAVEVHYFADIFEKLQYDAMYHEHLCNYSLLPLDYLMNKHNMEIFDVKRIPIHSGSIRIYAKKKSYGGYQRQQIVDELIAMEKKRGFGSEKVYFDFAEKVRKTKEKIVSLLLDLKKQSKSIVGYGAGGRSHIIVNYCQINENLLDYVVDESPERYNKFLSGIHIPVYSYSEMKKSFPDYYIMFAWNYKEEILKKEKEFLEKGGKFIIPLPDVEIIQK